MPIYLDYQATTPVDPRVLKAMIPCFSETFGNPASIKHTHGNKAGQLVERARGQIAQVINAKSREIVFTSGATEACNLAIQGVSDSSKGEINHFITVVTEHSAVLENHKALEKKGHRVTYLPVASDGLLDLCILRQAICQETKMISVMAVNNEIGVIQNIAAIGNICKENGILFFTDATQALGKLPLDVKMMNIHMLACSAHKVYGPKGVGALYVRSSNPRVKLCARILGGGQERKMRSGTLNVPGIVGFGEAVNIAATEMKKENKRLSRLRTALMDQLETHLGPLTINGSLKTRIPGNLNVYIGIPSEALMVAIRDELSISSGSACSTLEVLPSHVLCGLGLSEEEAYCSIRIGLGRETSHSDVAFAANTIGEAACRLRGQIVS
jgi:cysteine desulfurase